MSSKEYLPTASGVRGNLRPMLTGVLMGIAVCMILLLVFAGILSARNVPQSFINPMATLSVSVGGLVAGFVCTRLTRTGGLLYGLLTGATLSVIMMLVSLGVSDGGIGIPALFKTIFIMLCAAIGGIMGVNARPRKSRQGKSGRRSRSKS